MREPSSTPETDAAWEVYQADPTCEEGDPWALASRLERERNKIRQAWWYKSWNEAIQAALLKIPGGDTCDPQTVADDIRSLRK